MGLMGLKYLLQYTLPREDYLIIFRQEKWSFWSLNLRDLVVRRNQQMFSPSPGQNSNY